jgi:hypothetical protein
MQVLEVFTATTRDYLQTLIDRQYIKPLDLTDLNDNVILSFDRGPNGFINVYLDPLGKYPIVSFSNTDPWLVADLFVETKVPCDLLNDFDNTILYFSTSDGVTEWLLTGHGLLMTKSNKKWVIAFKSELKNAIFSIQSVSSQTKFFIESVWPDFFLNIPNADFSYHKSDR